MNLMELFVKISADTSGLASGLADAERRASGFTNSGGAKLGGFHNGLKKLAKLSAVALGAATTAAVAFGKKSVEAGMEFDSSMSQVGATMGFTVEELNDKTSDASKTMEELRNFAMEMGSTTAFSATEAADALNYMALAGYDAETSMKMLPTVLNLAASGGIELAQASDMVTDAQTALGLSIDETVVMVDQMAAAASSSNTSVQQLGDAILTVGGTAKNLKGGTEELNTVLGILADNGIKGSEAGTHLRNIMLSLTAPTDKAGKIIKELGIDVADADGNMRSMEDIMYDLNAAMEGMGADEKTQIISKLFNKTDIASVNALLATSSDRWHELTNAVGDSAGAAEAMANVQLDNLEGDITLFKSALEGVQITLSDVLTPTLREFVQFGSEGLQSLGEAFRNGGLDEAMNSLGDTITAGLALIVSNVPKMIDAGTQLLVALVKGLVDNLPQITDAAMQTIFTLSEGLSDEIPTLVPKMVEAVTTMVTTLLSNGPRILAAGGQLIVALAKGVVASIPIVIKAIPQIISGMISTLTGGIVQFNGVGGRLIEGLYNGISNKVNWVVGLVKGLGTKVINAAKSIFGIHSPSKVFQQIGDYCTQGFAEGIEPIGELTKNGTIKMSGMSIDAATGSGSDSYSDMTAAMYEAMSAALDNHQISFNNRELGRLVRSYV